MKKFFLGAAAIALAIGSFSCDNAGGAAKLTTDADSAAYAQGLLQGSQFKEMLSGMEEQEGAPKIDKAAFLKGFEQAFGDSTQFSYFAGGITGAQLLQQMKGDSIDAKLFLKAFREALNSDSTTTFLMSVDSARTIAHSFQEKKQLARMREQYGPNIEKGKAYIAEFQKEEGVQTTPSGIAYKVLQAGTGATPTAEDQVKVNYVGTTIDGKEFDKNEGIEFPLNGVIKGWTEILQLMKEGEKVKVAIPYELAYGERGSYSIEPYSTLVFEIELLKVIKVAPATEAAAPAETN